MTIRLAIFDAYRDVFRQPGRILRIAAIPLALAAAAHIAIANGPVEQVLRAAADFHAWGMRPLSPIYWFLIDLPWVWFAATFIHRWQCLALMDATPGPWINFTWPIWDRETVSMASKATLIAGYAALLMHWAGHGFNHPEFDIRICVQHVSDNTFFGKPLLDLHSDDVDKSMACREQYLRGLRTYYYVTIIPVSAGFVSFLTLAKAASARGQTIAIVRKSPLLVQECTSLLVGVFLVIAAASALYQLGALAISLIPDGRDPYVLFTFASHPWGDSPFLQYHRTNPAILERTLTDFVGLLASFLAISGISVLMEKSYRSLVGEAPSRPSADPD